MNRIFRDRIHIRCWLLLIGLLSSPVLAQPKPGYEPSSTHIFPAGGRRGTTIPVRVGGECFPPGTRFIVSHGDEVVTSILEERAPAAGDPSPRRRPTEIPITYPKEWTTEITLSKSDRLDALYWRLSCAQGATVSRPFLVGDLPEFIERESNSTLEQAEDIALPVTVNGQICGERDTDHFRFSAKAGDVIVCEVVARRLGSPLDPVADVMDPRGKKLPSSHVYRGDDPVIAVNIQQDGDYILRMAHVSFHGNPSYVYRLNLTKCPYIIAAFPSGGRRGTQREVTLYALTGKPVAAEFKQAISIPDSGPFQFRSSRFANPLTLVATETDHVLEVEPNQTQAESTVVQMPVTIDGQLIDSADVDWFRFTAPKGQPVSITCRTSPFQSSALPAIALFDRSEKLLKESWSIDETDRQCVINWTPTQTGDYLLRVQDVRFGSKGGPDFVYRLSIGPARPDFKLYAAADCVNVMQGGAAKLSIKLRRLGGFSGPVQLDFGAVPDGVSIEGKQIPAGKSDIDVKITTDGDARVQFSTLRISGDAEVAGQQVSRMLNAKHLGHDSEGTSFQDPTVSRVFLNVLHKPVFRLFCSEAYQYAHRGSVFLYPMQIERLNGFDGEITLQIGDRQNRDLDGIEMFEVTIPGDQSEIELPIYLPETMHINIQSQSQLYAQAYARFLDRHQLDQAVTVLSEKRNMLRTLPPVVKLKALKPEIPFPRQGDLKFEFAIERTNNFSGPMELRLIEPKRLSAMVSPVAIDENALSAELLIPRDVFASADSPAKIRFRATGMMDRTRLITEASTLVLDVE